MSKFPDCFPSDFEERILPKDAKHQALFGYRLVGYGLDNPMSYCSTYEECLVDQSYKDYLVLNEKYDEQDAGLYSTSLCKTLSVAKWRMRGFKRRHPSPVITCGITRPQDGFSLEDSSKHISWWLYKEAEPNKYFELVEEKNEEKSLD